MSREYSLLFIPDITGFTNFVKTTEIAHSQHIISELLEVLLKANDLDMTISEIEGDAILFYKHKHVPSLEILLEQSKRMFLEFHSHLRRYDRDRICHCGACSTASRLSLKIVAHIGEIGFIEVQDRKKPHGEDVILVHRLLKNNIENAEYLLITKELFNEIGKGQDTTLPEWAEVHTGQDEYENIGKIDYHYILLTYLNSEVEDPPPAPKGKRIKNPLRFETTIYRKAHEVYEIISNLDYRLSWNKGIEELHYEQNRVNRAGTRHVCLIGDQNIEFETVRSDFGEGKLVYGETLLRFSLARDLSVYFILEPVKDHTKLVLEVHFRSLPVLGWLLLPLLRRRFRSVFAENLPAIKEACERNHRLLTAGE
jgi:hypothetical protein